MMFLDRHEAGRALAARLRRFAGKHPVVLALPRGGVAVAFEVARELAAPLDLVLVRKIGAPQQPELAIGAVADGPTPEMVTDPHLMRMLSVSDSYLAETKTRELQEIERRRGLYLAGRVPVDIRGRVAIIIDDGIATGATMLAALRATRHRAPSRLVLAVPVASGESLARCEREADETICLETPEDFMAVGQFYRKFPQLEDEEVIALLDQAKEFGQPPQGTTQPKQGTK
jgi:putative phosphoribosyl transferase